MIEYSHVTKRFGKFTAVDDLSFALQPQEALALWGPNGAGKTTAIKCLLGLLRYRGMISVDGMDAGKNGKAVRRLLGYVPQELAFYADMSALDTALFYARLKGVAAERAQEAMQQVGLAEHGNKPVGALSGGMKQRLALGLALLADPPILVLDEPTSNLDAAARELFLAMLRDVKRAGKTIIFTSHRLEEVEALADTVLVMDGGRLTLVCAAAELPDRLGLRSRVKLRLPASQLERALAVLTTAGFTVSRNGVGVLVDVLPDQKAQPIQTLYDADVEVTDFEVL